tara:strand:+ start:3949 stop:4653 length:705 start_codon:yes stop_codon:yes gene_type:complete
MHEEYEKFAFSEENMPVYFADVIKHVIKRIDHGTVCDLGSHAIGHYWAMGYIERVESYSCYDLSSEAIQLFKNTINNWQTGDLLKKYPVFINYLYDNNIITASPELIEKQLIEKLDVVKVFDFLKDKPDKQYDIVMANESLPVVDSYDELLIAMQTAYDFTKENGLFLSVSSPYDRETDDIIEMQQYKIEGTLSPTAEMMENAIKAVGFKNIDVKSMPIHYENYTQLDICSAYK